MKTPNSVLREQIYSKLVDAITVNTTAVPVFDLIADEDAQKPYIIISSSAVIPDDIDKDTITYQTTVTLDLNAAYDGSKIVDDMANQVAQVLDVTAYDLGDDFKFIGVGIDDIQTVPIDIFETDRVARNIMTFRYLITQKK